MNYADFLKSKEYMHATKGFEPTFLAEALFPFQREIVKWACELGKAAIFADCGLGKTLMQLSWAASVPGDVLILAPLAVSEQTRLEGVKFGIEVNRCEEAADVKPGINITNYERLAKFDCSRFAGVVLDESSILKNYTGKTRNFIIESFRATPYKLACTATPAPNDFMELGNHCEFLDVKSRTEMLAEYFVHDGGETQKWRIKGHAQKPFWQWISTWAVKFAKPSDLGFSDEGFQLPELKIIEHFVRAKYEDQGFLFPMMANTMAERRDARKLTIDDRARMMAEQIALTPDEPWVIWCNLNAEADAIMKLLPGAVEIRGSHSPELKRERMMGFSEGRIQILVTKPSIAGFGMNWQHCANTGFLGLSDSYEDFYQVIRRFYRFGQKRIVKAHVVIADTEGAVVANIKRKESQAAELASEMNYQPLKQEAA